MNILFTTVVSQELIITNVEKLIMVYTRILLIAGPKTGPTRLGLDRNYWFLVQTKL